MGGLGQVKASLSVRILWRPTSSKNWFNHVQVRLHSSKLWVKVSINCCVLSVDSFAVFVQTRDFVSNNSKFHLRQNVSSPKNLEKVTLYFFKTFEILLRTIHLYCTTAYCKQLQSPFYNKSPPS